ncbi:MAG: transglutaminase-like domain-containing protein [Phycisphaerales bacterium]
MHRPSPFSASRRAFMIAATACVLLGAALPAAAQERIERWYRVELMGQKAGWMRELTETADGRITTTSESKISLARDAIPIVIEMDSAFVETVDGKPISMRSRQLMAAQEVVKEYTFGEAGVKEITMQGGRRTETDAERPAGEWLTPAAARVYFNQRLKAGAQEITVRTVTAENGLGPVTSKYTGLAPAKVTVRGHEIDAHRCDVELSMTPGMKSVEYVDGAGTMVKTETSLGGIKMVLTLSTQEDAAGEVKAPEIMINTFVKPDRVISKARTTASAVYVVSDPDALPDLPTTGAQGVERIDGKSARVRVASGVWAAAPEADLTDAAYLKASSMVDSSDEKIKGMAEKALAAAGDKTPAERAEILRRFAHAFIRSKNLGSGFASASEVARTKSGDCSEHGVFTAALLRAAGIPSRVAAGLIYADSFAGSKDIFGYHMWTQALIEVDGQRRWVDLDATLPDATPFDATHITLAVSALPEGELAASLASMATTLGRLSIKVEAVSQKPGAEK